MPANFVHEGNSIDYTPGSAVSAGDVVLQGDLHGVATRDIAANELGALDIEGVFDLPKDNGGSSAIGAGVTVYWDDTADEITTTEGSNKVIGKTVVASVDDDTSQRVKLIP